MTSKTNLKTSQKPKYISQKSKSFTGHINFMGQKVIPNLTQLEAFQIDQSNFVKITSKMMTPGAYSQEIKPENKEKQINKDNNSKNNQQNG